MGKPPEITLPREEDTRTDPTRLYMREIGEVPLLTILEEKQLAKRIQKGDAAAREHMIRANLRLVVKIAREYENYGLPLLDLISEGNIGLMKAVERFDSTKGAKLSTYASWWIKQSIKRGLADQSKTIRLPVHVIDKLFYIRKCETALMELLGRIPTDREISEEIKVPMEKVGAYRKASSTPISLDAHLGNDETSTFADMVADPNTGNVVDLTSRNNEHTLLHEALKQLTPREQVILELRFGLGTGDEETLEEVGGRFKLTRERIRQIQKIATGKLKRILRRKDGLMSTV